MISDMDLRPPHTQVQHTCESGGVRELILNIRPLIYRVIHHLSQCGLFPHQSVPNPSWHPYLFDFPLPAPLPAPPPLSVAGVCGGGGVRKCVTLSSHQDMKEAIDQLDSILRLKAILLQDENKFIPVFCKTWV